MELNFLGHEAVRMINFCMMSYKPKGDPMWLLRTVRTICVQYVRALGVAYGGREGVGKNILGFWFRFVSKVLSNGGS